MWSATCIKEIRWWTLLALKESLFILTEKSVSNSLCTWNVKIELVFKSSRHEERLQSLQFYMVRSYRFTIIRLIVSRIFTVGWNSFSLLEVGNCTVSLFWLLHATQLDDEWYEVDASQGRIQDFLQGWVWGHAARKWAPKTSASVSYDQSEFFPDTDKICHHIQYLKGKYMYLSCHWLLQYQQIRQCIIRILQFLPIRS